jgi:uncharacterized membrane protein YfbV (UPF0208 family)
MVLWDADGSADAAAIIAGGEDRAMGSMTLSSAAIRDGLMGLVWKGSLVAAPANPLLNWAYYNISDKTSYIYDGDRWETLAISGQDGADGTNGVDGVNGTDGVNGVGIVWIGAWAEEPVNPQLNWVYYNSIEGKSYIYDGYAWQILSQDGTDGVDGVNGIDGVNGTDGVDGVGIVWIGAWTEEPRNPQLNWAYYSIIEGKSYIYDGYAWQILSQDGTDGVDGVNGTDGANGVGIVWIGAWTEEPGNPQLNWVYYNSIERKSYIYDGYCSALDELGQKEGSI